MKADTAEAQKLIKTAKGQLDGILKMIDDDRYCVDIMNQVQAAISILHKVNSNILQAHMKSCVTEAVLNNELDEKLSELCKLIDKRNR